MSSQNPANPPHQPTEEELRAAYEAELKRSASRTCSSRRSSPC